MDNCDFCKNIYTIEEYQAIFDKNWWDCLGTYILKNKKTGELTIFVALDDYYYNCNAVHNVKYCPCCGRELS